MAVGVAAQGSRAQRNGPTMPALPPALEEMPLIGFGVGTAWFRSRGARARALKGVDDASPASENGKV